MPSRLREPVVRIVTPARVALAAAGGGLLAWSLVTPRLRDAEGFLDTPFCLPLAAALGLLVLAAAPGTRLARSAAWGVLALLGQAALLQLVDAGPVVAYQHYGLAGGSVSPGDLGLLGGLAVQASAVAVALRRELGGILRWIGGRIGPLRALVGAGFLAAVSAFPSAEAGPFALEIAFAAGVQLVQLACVVLAVRALPEDTLARFDPGGGARDGGRRRVDPVAAGAALWVLGVSTLLAFSSYERHPHVPDEVGYVYQARYLARGQLSTPAPPVPEAFDAYLIECSDTRCISPVPPGWPALLAVGERLGARSLVNPMLGALCVLLAYALLARLYDVRTARVGALLLAASPWLLFLSMSFMTHNASLLLALLAACAALGLWRSGRLRFALAAGLALGLMTLIRPLDAVAAALPVGLAAALAPWPLRRRAAALAALGLAGLLGSGVTLSYNRALTGDPTGFPLMQYADREFGAGRNALGFGPDRGLGWSGLDPFPGHGPVDVVVNAWLNTAAIDVELFGWSSGSLVALALFALLAHRSRGSHASDRWMLLAIASVVGLYSLYWFAGGPDFGARYWYLVLVPCVALSARGLERLGRALSAAGVRRAESAVAAGAGILSLLALVTFVPWRAIDKYHHYRSMRPGVRELLQEHQLGAALVLVRGERHPDYASAIVYNPLDPRAPEPVLAWDRSPEVRRRLLRAYPERRVWVLEGPSRTGDEYTIREETGLRPAQR